MRAVYATYLDFQPATPARDVHRTVCRWLADSAQSPDSPDELDRELRGSWSKLGRDTVPLHAGETLDIDVIKVAGDRLWQFAWARPSRGDRELNEVFDIVVGYVGGRVSASVVVRIERRRERLEPVHYDLHAPDIVAKLVRRFPVCDAGLRLSSKARPVSANSAPSFLEHVLLDSKRSRPVLALSCDDHSDTLFDADDLAHDLCGLAHVYVLAEEASAALEDKLGEPLACSDGALRLYWPGLTRFDEPYMHPCYTPEKLDNWTGVPLRVHLFRRLCAVATATLAAPQAFVDVRRRARRTRLAPGYDVPSEWLEEMERALERADSLEAELTAARERISELEQPAPGRRSERDNGGGAAVLVRPRTVLEAVEAADAACPHLVFLDAARASARACPFQRPTDMHDALLKLEELAALYARPDGAGGRISDVARNLGLSYAGGVSSQAVAKAPDGAYEAWWPERGRRVTLGPHIKLGSGHGAGRIARVYFAFFNDVEDPGERRFLIGHVGRMLPNTTTG